MLAAMGRRFRQRAKTATRQQPYFYSSALIYFIQSSLNGYVSN
jgi:hypothetical protein